ncbi:MAG: cupin domain-containing protein [Verrucomicrobiota bacterium]
MTKDTTAEYWIRALGLEAHPEGGWFRETYRSAEEISAAALPARYDSARCFGTSIYFLLGPGEVSKFHRIRSDEIWHYHCGDSVTLHLLDERAGHRSITAGPDIESGEVLQAIVPANTWFGAKVTAERGFCLIGCTVTPGFDFADFELAEREALSAQFPSHRELILQLT